MRNQDQKNRPEGCKLCATRSKEKFDLDIRMAFQPIVDSAQRSVFAYEALVRGPAGEGAVSVLSQVNHENRYAFDQKCRVVAIETAARIGLTDPISINFMPNAVYKPENCIQTTLWAADKCNFPVENIIFEFTEGELVSDLQHLKNIFDEYAKQGFRTAIDDFGSGYSGLIRLADLRPDIVKLDMELIRDIHMHPRRRKIVSAILALCEDLEIQLLAEGIETAAEYNCLADLGIEVFQGYLFGKPTLERFHAVDEIKWEGHAA